MVECVLNIHVAKRLKWRLLIDQFLSMQNYRFIRMRLKIPAFESLHLWVHLFRNIRQADDDSSQTQKTLIWIISIFQIGVARFVYV